MDCFTLYLPRIAGLSFVSAVPSVPSLEVGAVFLARGFLFLGFLVRDREDLSVEEESECERFKNKHYLSQNATFSPKYEGKICQHHV